MPAQKSLFIPPVLRNRNGDISKQWYVEYSYLNPITNKVVRKKVSKGLEVSGINDDDTRLKRSQIGAQLIEELNRKIKAGWSPLSDVEKNYIDNIEYKSIAQVYGRMRKAKRTIRMATSAFLDFKKPVIKVKTYQSYLSKTRKFVAWCEMNHLGDCDISALTNADIKTFFTYLCSTGLDKRTVEKYRQNLYSFFEWCKEERTVAENPVFKVQIPSKKVDAASRPLIQADMRLFLQRIEFEDPQLYLACLFQYYTAIRPGTELRLLRIGDIDFYKGAITVNDVDAKEARHETVDMPVQLRDLCTERYLLQNYPKSHYIFGTSKMPGPRPVGQNTLRNRFNVVRDALGLPEHYKFYSMKHTGAGRLLDSGATISEVMNHLRHKSIEDTQYYIERHFGQRNKKVINHFPDP